MIDVRWAPLARADFERMDTYYRAIDGLLADRIGRRILAATALLSDLPLAGPVAATGDWRKWKVARTPYILFYRVTDTHVRILRVLHAGEGQRVK